MTAVTRPFLDSLFGLTGRRAVVTGGSSGIGLAMAEALGREGAPVCLVARDASRLARAAARLTNAGVDASTASCDMADAGAVAAFAARAADGAFDILVAAAGVNPRPDMSDITGQEYAATMQVNVHAPFALAQALAPGMAARGWGRIILIGSQQSWSAFGRSGAYGVSKAAVGGLTRSLAERWSPHGVTVNCVVPGFVSTPMTRTVFDDPARARAMAARTMTGRNGEPADLAGVAVFLASGAGAYVTGQMIAVDGGFSVH